jgi:hypothetical protein
MDDPSIDSVDPKSNSDTPPAETPRKPDFVPQIPPSIEGNQETTRCKPDQTPWWKMILETAAVFIGIYVAGIYHGQLSVMQGQLGEIIKQYPELHTSAEAAKSAADTAARQLELTERPWVFVKSARVVSPLVFSGGGASVVFEIVLKNVGPSPATDVLLSPRLYLMPLKEDAIRPVERLCNNKIPSGVSLPGLTLFPGADSPPQRMSVGLTEEDIKKSTSWGIISITPIICVAYRPTFNPDARYYSGIQYPLWPTIWPKNMRPGSSIPINKLPMNRNGFFGEVAH